MRYVDGERDPENVAWATAASSSIVADALGMTYPLRAWWWRRSATDYTKPSDDFDRIAGAFGAKDAVSATPQMRAWLDVHNLWDAAELASNWRTAVYAADQTTQDLNDTITSFVTSVMPEKAVEWMYEQTRRQLARQKRDADAKKTAFLDYISKLQGQATAAASATPAAETPSRTPRKQERPPVTARPPVAYEKRMPNVLKWALLGAGAYGLYWVVRHNKRT